MINSRNICWLLFVCMLGLPVCAVDEPVQVLRKVKQMQQKQSVAPVKQVEPKPIQVDNLSLIKSRGEAFAKYRLSIPKSRANEVSDSDFCQISNELEEYGATNIIIYMLNMQHKENGKPIIDGKNFKNSKYCIKITFKYLNKPYETGWCRP